MAITNAFRDAVSNADVRGVRIMMKDSLLVDPTFAEFNEMSALARNVPNLYDEHDNRSLIMDETEWNDDYMDKLMVQVVGNFSHERIEHLQKVVRHLRHVQAYQKTQENRSAPSKNQNLQRSYQEQKREDERNNLIINRGTKIAAGAVAGGVAGGVIAGVAGGMVGVSVVAGAVVVGAVVAVATIER